MTLTAAERQRRSRKHRSGDHSLCDPAKCPESVDAPVTSDVTPPVTRDVTPRDLGTRGRRLWRDQTAAAKLGPAELVLLEEACRIADRLDKLDAFLQGREDAWVRFHRVNEDGSIVRVVVDRALSEARQQADTLRGIVADLIRKQQGAQQSEEPKGSILDELAKRRTERQQQASG